MLRRIVKSFEQRLISQSDRLRVKVRVVYGLDPDVLEDRVMVCCVGRNNITLDARSSLAEIRLVEILRMRTPSRIAQVDFLVPIPAVEPAQEERTEMVRTSARDSLHATSPIH